MKKGFSLVEISIVLLVISVLLGGIVLGNQLVVKAKLTKVVREVNKYKVAINNFRAQYTFLPGDYSEASTYINSSLPNGNGDNIIDYGGAFTTLSEEHYAWRHMASAGMIEGDYTSTAALTSIPQSVYKGGYYRVAYQSDVYDSYGHMISFTGLDSSSNPSGPILSVDKLRNMDLKLDDGLADSGKIIAYNESGVSGCVSNDYDAASTGTYVTTNIDEVKCKVFFKMD